MSRHYLDAQAFTHLFRRRWQNHSEICLGLQKIVQNVMRKFTYDNANDRDDLEADALLASIERIDRFKFDRGRNALAYYTSVVIYFMKNACRRARTRRPGPACFTDISDDGEIESLDDQPVLRGAVMYSQAAY